jgi:hypothetical protein
VCVGIGTGRGWYGFLVVVGFGGGLNFNPEIKIEPRKHTERALLINL